VLRAVEQVPLEEAAAILSSAAAADGLRYSVLSGSRYTAAAGLSGATARPAGTKCETPCSIALQRERSHHGRNRAEPARRRSRRSRGPRRPGRRANGGFVPLNEKALAAARAAYGHAR
jgi:hypothetical protein